MAFIEVSNLSFSYKGNADKKILKNLNFSLDEGSVTAVLGLSGCGKTPCATVFAALSQTPFPANYTATSPWRAKAFSAADCVIGQPLWGW